MIDSAGAERDWSQAGDALLDKGDGRIADDDFDTACRCYLVAAWCFAQAWRSSRAPFAARKRYRTDYRFALLATEPLLAGQSHWSSSRVGSSWPSLAPEAHNRSRSTAETLPRS